MHCDDRAVPNLRASRDVAEPRQAAVSTGLRLAALAMALVLVAGCGGGGGGNGGGIAVGGGGGNDDGDGDDGDRGDGDGNPGVTYSAQLIGLRLDNAERPGQSVTWNGLPVHGATITRNP